MSLFIFAAVLLTCARIFSVAVNRARNDFRLLPKVRMITEQLAQRFKPEVRSEVYLLTDFDQGWALDAEIGPGACSASESYGGPCAESSDLVDLFVMRWDPGF